MPGEFRPFYFVHISDPHLGFLAAADARFARLVDQINQLKPDFVVLTGDLTYGLSDRHVAAIDSALRRFQVPVKIIPGNHDVRDQESLRTYRRDYGKDYYVFTHNNCDFVFLDSMTLDGDTTYFHGKDSQFRQEVQDQWSWLEKTLADSRAQGREHVFMLMHIPPYINKEDDRGQFTCMSPPSRSRLLSLGEKYGVEAILAGHIHRTIELQAGKCAISTVGGTYFPVDRRGYGYRVFKVERGRISSQYVRLEEGLKAWSF